MAYINGLFYFNVRSTLLEQNVVFRVAYIIFEAKRWGWGSVCGLYTEHNKIFY